MQCSSCFLVFASYRRSGQPVVAADVLRSLHLNRTQVTDAGLEHLKGLSNLEHLILFRWRVTDGGRMRVTDAGLEHLKGLTSLKALVLAGTRVTDEGIKKLRQALPNCAIQH